MNTEELLIRACCENYEEVTPRLLLADYLLEQGEVERAEWVKGMSEWKWIDSDGNWATHDSVVFLQVYQWIRAGTVWREFKNFTVGPDKPWEVRIYTDGETLDSQHQTREEAVTALLTFHLTVGHLHFKTLQPV